MSPRASVALLCLAVSPALGCDGAKLAPTAASVEAPSFARQPGVANAEAAPAGGGKPAAPNAPAELKIERKIIFNGSLEVIVKDFLAAREQLTKLIAEQKGYFSKTDIAGHAGSQRTGTFTIKVPVDKFQTTVDALTNLGATIRNSTDSQDVTEEFVDIDARVKNLKNEEEVLNKLLQNAAGRLDELFKIREQIRLVRGDIERAEGRLKALSALTSLSTITLTLREQSDYVPPPIEAPPTFGNRVSGTFGASFDLLKQVGEAIVIGLTAAAPWLPFVVVFGFALRWFARLGTTRPIVTPAARAPEVRA